MMLEDHLGDILRKSRLGLNLSIAEVAKAAGLAESNWAELEQTGRVKQRPAFAAVAPLLQLDAKKLEGIAGGWTPPPIDTSGWREIRQISTVANDMAVNSYLVWDEATREAALFDTGWVAEPVLELIAENQLNPVHLFLTHSHQDHIAALEDIRAAFPKIKLHSSSRHAPPVQRNRANDFLHLGSLRLTNRDTPGHAEDGVTYIIGNFPEDGPNAAVVGDALFSGSMGGAKEHFALAKQKIREQIFSLPGSTLICPGHGPLTTVEIEKAHNPFFDF